MSSTIWSDWLQECDRCELLGLPCPPRPKTPEPGENETHKEKEQEDEDEQEEGATGYQQTTSTITTTLEENLNETSDQLNNVSGGLDQLNSILGVTQKKLNRFKVVCGSLTNLLKIRGREEEGIDRVDSSDSVNSSTSTSKTNNLKTDLSSSSSLAEARPEGVKHQAIDLEENISSQIDKLDLILMKAEKANISMDAQRKQMKNYLAK